MARSGHDWRPKLPFWKREGDFWYCYAEDLRAAISAAGVDDDHIRRRMGHGYHLLAKAMDGVMLTKYEVGHVEWSLEPDGPLEPGLSSP
jgi:hypothetical protein